jgi:hypothetical protein
LTFSLIAILQPVRMEERIFGTVESTVEHEMKTGNLYEDVMREEARVEHHFVFKRLFGIW